MSGTLATLTRELAQLVAAATDLDVTAADPLRAPVVPGAAVGMPDLELAQLGPGVTVMTASWSVRFYVTPTAGGGLFSAALDAVEATLVAVRGSRTFRMVDAAPELGASAAGEVPAYLLHVAADLQLTDDQAAEASTQESPA